MTGGIINHPILVVSYNDVTRAALVESLEKLGVTADPCATFRNAEDNALEGIYNGIVVDLQTIIKAKEEEKVVACSLTGFYPTLRVRVQGTMMVPMAMPGDAKQDSSMADFIAKSCAAFTPRAIRQHKRKEVGLSVITRHRQADTRGFVVNLSWGGAFLIHMEPERFQRGDELTVSVAGSDIEIASVICWIRPWGTQLPPGIGISFTSISDAQENLLAVLLKHDRNKARDRLVAL